jgi:hypothetical protein
MWIRKNTMKSLLWLRDDKDIISSFISKLIGFFFVFRLYMHHHINEDYCLFDMWLRGKARMSKVTSERNERQKITKCIKSLFT